MKAVTQFFRRGDPFIWFTGSALGACLLLIGGLIAVILTNGLGLFWPRPLHKATLRDGTVLLGERMTREPIPDPGNPEHLKHHRVQLKVGNRDLGADFRWVTDDEVASWEKPGDAVSVERREYGPFFGFPKILKEGDTEVASGFGLLGALEDRIAQAHRDRDKIRELEGDEMGDLNRQLEMIRLEQRGLDMAGGGQDPAALEAKRRHLAERSAALEERYLQKQQELEALVERASRPRVTFATADGQEKELRLLDVFRVYPANALGWFGRARIYASRLWGFMMDDPREANTEGGIFPAIFGTVMMVLIMSVAVVPFGVIAALYLREYAREGTMLRLVRIAVNNLAGVPSIVYGVFGLGFFVYFVGGGIDRLFFPERLPTPTYGTGGILWASLTLALLTVPVVIVAAEEALAAVPRSMREASVAVGATKFQTITRVVLPAAAPGILTGMILAMARGAGEVAPLMITGVVKLAPELPVDGVFPFFHLERKFMHLGFHVFDVGFQSPNVEAAKPMVYMTTIFLLAIIMLLNLTAIVVRNHLRRKYRTSAF
jgi:phosphate transport system permease protein